jgi:uncharacterized membrane protein
MLEFAASFSAFVAAHVIPAAIGLRERMIAAIGRPAYMAAYSALSVALLVWLIWSAQRAPYVELWPPAPWRYAAPLVAMPFALSLFGAAVVRANPLSVSFRRSGDRPQIAGVLTITRHPILWAFLLWSASHLVANGDLVAVILFGSLALFSLQGMAALDRRSRKKLGEREWSALASRSSAVPFAAVLSGRTALNFGAVDVAGLVAGLGVYAAMLAGAHAWLFGVVPYWM